MGLKTKKCLMYMAIITTCMFSYIMRLNFPLPLVAITNENESIVIRLSCIKKSHRGIEKVDLGPFSKRKLMNNHVQAQLIAGYFYGYVLGYIPALFIVQICGSVYSMGLSMIFSAAINSVIPPASEVHWSLVLYIRTIMGFFGILQFTAICNASNHWTSNKIDLSLAILGAAHCSVFILPVLGKIIMNMGWNWCFYLTSIIALIWFCICFAICLCSPKIKRLIAYGPVILESDSENVIPDRAVTSLANKNKEKLRLPYREIFFSGRVWMIILSEYSYQYLTNMFVNDGPQFLVNVLEYNYYLAGIIIMIQSFLSFMMSIFFIVIGRIIISNKPTQKKKVRRWFTIISHIVPGVILILVRLKGCDRFWIISMITATFALSGAFSITTQENYRDLSPKHEGNFIAVISSVSATSGIFAPTVDAILTANIYTLEDWHMVFLVCGNLLIICGIFFMFGLTVDEEKWSKTDRPQVRMKERNND